jgi:hypothetical protein
MFWNSDWAIPVGATVKELPTEKDWKAMLKRLEDNISATGYPYPIYQNLDELRTRLVQIRDNFIWAFWLSILPGSPPTPRSVSSIRR